MAKLLLDRSRENTLQIRARMTAGLAIKPVAIKTEALTVARFHPEIIAGGFFLLPPFHGDTLGPFDAGDVELGTSPAEAHRRAFRHARHGYADFFGLFQQPERPKRRIIVLAAARPYSIEIAILGRDRHALRFRDVRILGDEALHAMFAKARGQPVHQESDLPTAILLGV